LQSRRSTGELQIYGTWVWEAHVNAGYGKLKILPQIHLPGVVILSFAKYLRVLFLKIIILYLIVFIISIWKYLHNAK